MRGVAWYVKIFDAEGIPYQTGEVAPGRGSIVARLHDTAPASSAEPAFVLLNHIDVVPASLRNWSVYPFAAEMKDGYISGRGATDMKSVGVAQLIAFLELHRQHVPLRRDVIFLATADEEDGTVSGAKWVVEQKPDWVAGAGFVINEGSGARADANGKVVYVGIGAFNKTTAWLRIVATGSGGARIRADRRFLGEQADRGARSFANLPVADRANSGGRARPEVICAVRAGTVAYAACAH